MTDPSGQQPAAGTGTEPTATPSTPAGVQPASEQVTITKAEFDKITNTLSQLESLVRSDKDRGISRANQRLDKLETNIQPLLERAAEFMKEGKTPQQAIAEANSEFEDDDAMETLKDFAQFWKQGGKQLLERGNGNPADNGVNVTQVFGEILGQDALKNPLLAPVLAKQYANIDDAKVEAYRIFYQMSQLPNPNNAQASSLQGGGGSGTSADKILTELRQLQNDPTNANMERRAQLVKDLSALEGQ